MYGRKGTVKIQQIKCESNWTSPSALACIIHGHSFPTTHVVYLGGSGICPNLIYLLQIVTLPTVCLFQFLRASPKMLLNLGPKNGF
jgi:hypothetical protein